MNSQGTLNAASATNNTGSGYAQLGQLEEPRAAAASQGLASRPHTMHTKMASTWGQASTVMRVVAFACLVGLFYWMPGWMRWLFLAMFLTLSVIRFRQHIAETRQEDILQSNFGRIDRERQDSELMVHQAAQLMLDLDRNHLEEFVIKNPSGTYEEWIGELHPDNFHDGVLDHRFYVEDSDHRKLWNDSLSGSVREFVPTRSGGGY